jgi:hypothetical protein
MAFPGMTLSAVVTVAQNGYVINFQGKSYIATDDNDLLTQLISLLNPQNTYTPIQVQAAVKQTGYQTTTAQTTSANTPTS